MLYQAEITATSGPVVVVSLRRIGTRGAQDVTRAPYWCPRGASFKMVNILAPTLKPNNNSIYQTQPIQIKHRNPKLWESVSIDIQHDNIANVATSRSVYKTVSPKIVLTYPK